MTTYRQRHLDGHHTHHDNPTPPNQPNTDDLPGRHAPLNQLANDNNITFSAEDLSITDKQNEIRAALTK